VLLALFAAFVLLYATDPAGLYPPLVRALGFDARAAPFIDLEGVLSAIDCHRMGYDVIATNPCDPELRTHNYGPVWLLAAATPVTRHWLVPLSIVLDLLFIAALVALPVARGRREVAFLTLAAISSSVTYALERANVDLIIFLLITVAALAALRGPLLRLAGYAAILFATTLKLYPATALVLLARERPLRCAAIAVLCLALLGTYVTLEAETLRRSVALIPTGMYFHDRFGAVNLPAGLHELGLLPGARGAQIVQGLLALAPLALALRLAFAPGLAAALARLTPAEDVFLMVGAALILGCFFTAQNVAYRGVFLLFVLPGLTALWRIAPDPRWRAAFAAQSIVTLLLLWEGAARTPLEFDISTLGTPLAAALVWHGRQVEWLAREVLWWAFVPLLVAIVLRQARLGLRP
jgi:hypothetical protein